jgi:hypothetical protein
MDQRRGPVQYRPSAYRPARAPDGFLISQC